jgi:hypothetical protein
MLGLCCTISLHLQSVLAVFSTLIAEAYTKSVVRRTDYSWALCWDRQRRFDFPKAPHMKSDGGLAVQSPINPARKARRGQASWEAEARGGDVSRSLDPGVWRRCSQIVSSNCQCYTL